MMGVNPELGDRVPILLFQENLEQVALSFWEPPGHSPQDGKFAQIHNHGLHSKFSSISTRAQKRASSNRPWNGQSTRSILGDQSIAGEGRLRYPRGNPVHSGNDVCQAEKRYKNCIPRAVAEPFLTDDHCSVRDDLRRR